MFFEDLVPERNYNMVSSAYGNTGSMVNLYQLTGPNKDFIILFKVSDCEPNQFDIEILVATRRDGDEIFYDCEYLDGTPFARCPFPKLAEQYMREIGAQFFSGKKAQQAS